MRTPASGASTGVAEATSHGSAMAKISGLTFMTGWAKYRALQSQNPVCIVAHMKLLCPAASSASSVVLGCLQKSRIRRKRISLIVSIPILALRLGLTMYPI